MKIAKILFTATLLQVGLGISIPGRAVADQLTPVVVFPAFHFTILEVKVNQQTVFPECPEAGKFEYWYQNPNPNPQFNQVCQDKLLTLVVDPESSKPMPERFSNQPGVDVKVKYYGDVKSAPYYQPLYDFLQTKGYVPNVNIRVAGYDSRLTPDIGNFLDKTIDLIEKTYHRNGNTPVHLVGHSNGPLYAQYSLTHTTQEWKDKYIHGFTPIAGNWPGQGLFYTIYFSGLNILDFNFPEDPANAASSAAMFQTHPSSYMSSADPNTFLDKEIVIKAQDTMTSYTPLDNLQLFEDAELTQAKELANFYIGLVKFASPAFYPNVDVYAEKGSGIETPVGTELADLSVGQVVNPELAIFFTRADGDGNQEDITNDAIQVWQNMSCFRFEFTDNPGVDHFALPSDTNVLNRLLNNLQRTKSVCP